MATNTDVIVIEKNQAQGYITEENTKIFITIKVQRKFKVKFKVLLLPL